jgi:hypothetical protein
MHVPVPKPINYHTSCPQALHLPLGSLFFSNVWGQAIESFDRKKYYVSFIDD